MGPVSVRWIPLPSKLSLIMTIWKRVVQYCVNGRYICDDQMYTMEDGLQNNCTTSAQVAVNAKQRPALGTKNCNANAWWFSMNTTLQVQISPNLRKRCHGNERSAFYHQTFINAVRSTGRRNSYRTLLVIQGIELYRHEIAWLKHLYEIQCRQIQASGRLMVEIHNYTPFNFCLMDADPSWGVRTLLGFGIYHSISTDVAHNANWDLRSRNLVDISKRWRLSCRSAESSSNEIFGRTQVVSYGDALTPRFRGAYWYNYTLHQAAAEWDASFSLGHRPGYWQKHQHPVKDQQQLAALVQSQNGTARNSGWKCISDLQ